AVTSGGRVEWVLSALLISLLPVTRYAGIVLLPVVFVGILAGRARREGLRPALLRASVFTLIACMPIAVWLAHGAANGQHATGRALSLHVVGRDALAMLADTIMEWMLPARLASVARSPLRVAAIAGFVALVVAAVWRCRRLLRDPVSERPGTFLRVAFSVFAAIYLPFLILVASFADELLRFDSRILSPLLVPALVLAAAEAWPRDGQV